MIDAVRWFLERVAEYSLSTVSSWDRFTAAIGEIGGTFTRLNSGLAWPYLLASVTIAGVAYSLSRKGEALSVSSFRAFLFPRFVYGHSSAWVDYRFYAVSVVLNALFFVPMLVGFALLAEKMGKIVLTGYLGWISPTTLPVPVLFAAMLGFYLLYDFINYVGHVLLHKVPFLWTFHQVHHSAEVLTPISGFRAHPVEFFVTAILRAPVIGFAVVFYQHISTQDLAATTIFGVSLIGFLHGLSGHHLQHSHLPISYGPLLDRILVTPIVHQAHHSIDPCHHDKNFGVKFSLWDWMFGTLCVPDCHERLQFGLVGESKDEFSTVGKLYVGPFKRVGGLLRRSLVSGLFNRPQNPVRSDGL
ncbi:MAG: Fatty acid hydroxylase domain-containing protein [Nitrospira sp.]|nr:MAG: Fatty acid hydroxylase domain-containing protein [Nitrospira sp.]